MEDKRPGFIRRIYRRLMRWINALRLLVLNLVFLLIVGMVVLALSATDIPSVPAKGALLLNIQGSLVDQKSYSDPLTQLMGEADPAQREVLMQDVIDAVTFAKDDQRINTLVLSLNQMSYGGISKMQEIAPFLQAFRDSGKKIIAIGDSYTQDQYWLAAQADEIYLHPMGGVSIEGYGLYRNYFKRALDKLEINFHIFRVGEYKSAMEPFMRNDMSHEAKQANLVWLQKLWQQYTNEITQRRGLVATAVDDYVNNMDSLLEQHQGDAASAAIAVGLVDGIKTRDQVNTYLVEQVGVADDDGYYQATAFKQYLWVKQLELSAQRSNDKIGVIVAAGTIVDGEQAAGGIGGDTLSWLIRDARLDDSVKALVLRIDSGGGSAFASEIIRRELELLQAAGKPLVVSMGSMAASGGYWIAAQADEIWATPTTLTGSIGIFGAFPTIDKSLANLGINTDGVGTTDFAGAMRIDRPLQPKTTKTIQSVIENGYRRFLQLVADGREMTVDEVSDLAEGRVWSGEDAKRLGLVDQLGGLQQAIEAAAGLAELDSFESKLLEIPLTPQEQFMKELSSKVAMSFPSSTRVNSNFLGLLQQWLFPLQSNFKFLNTMNDPQGIYLYCGFCAAL